MRRWIWGLGSAGLIVAIMVLGYRRSEVARASADLESTVLDAQRQGVPLTYDSLHPKPDAVRDARSSRFLLDVTSVVHLGFGSTLGSPKLADTPKIADTPSGRAELGLKLAKYEPVLKELERLIDDGPIEYDRKYELGPELLLPEFAGYKSVTHALCLRALLKARRGDQTSAFQDLRTAAKVNAQLAVDPTIIGAHIRVPNEAWILQTLNVLLAQWASDRHAIELAGRVIEDLGPLPDPRRILSAESVWGSHMIRYLQKQAMTPPPPGPFPDDGLLLNGKDQLLIRLEPVVRANQAHTVEYWQSVYQAMPKGSTDYLGIQKRLKAIGDEMESHEDVSHQFCTLSAPNFAQSFGTFELLKMRRRVARSAIQVLLEHCRRPGWPAAIPFSKRDLEDEFGKRPLTYRRIEGGFMVYSVGPNSRDEKGQNSLRSGTNEPDDVAFSIPFQARSD